MNNILLTLLTGLIGGYGAVYVISDKITENGRFFRYLFFLTALQTVQSSIVAMEFAGFWK